jgi:hypothetical protein
MIYIFTSQLTHLSSWADEMDAIQSPKDDGLLTLPLPGKIDKPCKVKWVRSVESLPARGRATTV